MKTLTTSFFRRIMQFFPAVLLLAACVKETGVTPSWDENSVFLYRRDILPVDLSPYNRLGQTKSSGTFAPFSFSYTLLDSAFIFQEEVKPGIVFTQTPLKGRLYSSLGEEDNRSVINARMFHIRYENCVQDKTDEYIVTMIPAREEGDKPFSFLDMPDFSGFILFSSLSGEFRKMWELGAGGVVNAFPRPGDSLTRSGTLTFYVPAAGRSLGGTKSPDNPEEDVPVLDGGQLTECVVIEVYRRRYPIQGFWELVNYVDNSRQPRPDDPDAPAGGGGPLEEEKDVLYTLTVESEFCSGQVESSTFYYPRKSEALLFARSSGNDSCIFHCWLNGTSLVSTCADLTVKMTRDYTFTARYQHISNKDCYKLARFSTDSLLRTKIDSLRKYTYDKEKGVARREDGSYYQLKGGSSVNIPSPAEPGIKYSLVYHTHPSQYCCLSPGDLIALYLMVSKERYTTLPDFHFGVVTQAGILTLNVSDLQKLKAYFAPLISKSSEEAKEIINRDMELSVSEMSGSDDYESYLRKAVPFFEQIGISTIYTRQGEKKSEIWSGVHYSSAAGELLWKDCIKN